MSAARTPTLSGLTKENERLLRCIRAAAACLHPDLGGEHERLAWWILSDALNGLEPREKLEEEERK